MPPLRIRRNIGLSSKSFLKWRGKQVETWLYGRLTRNLKEATERYH